MLFTHIYGRRGIAVVVNVSIGKSASGVYFARKYVCNTLILVIVRNTAEAYCVYFILTAFFYERSKLHCVCGNYENYYLSAFFLCELNEF